MQMGLRDKYSTSLLWVWSPHLSTEKCRVCTYFPIRKKKKFKYNPTQEK